MSVRLEIAEHVARVTIDRPEVLNAIDGDPRQSSRQSGSAWKPIAIVRVVVLTGAGDRGFCTSAPT